MYKITAEYRNHNPVKLVFPSEIIGHIATGTKMMLTDNVTETVGTVLRCYRTPRKRRIAWVVWDGESE